MGKLRQTANGAEEAEGGEEEVPGDQRPLQVEALLPQRHGRLQAEGEEDVGDAEVDGEVPVLVREAHDVVAVLQDVPLPGEDGGDAGEGRPVGAPVVVVRGNVHHEGVEALVGWQAEHGEGW